MKRISALVALVTLTPACSRGNSTAPCAKVVFEIQGSVEQVIGVSESDPLFSDDALGPFVATIPLGICEASRTDDRSNLGWGDYEPQGLTPAELQVGNFQLLGSGAPVHSVIGNQASAVVTFDGAPDAGGPIRVDGIEQPELHLYVHLYSTEITFDTGAPLSPDAYASLDRAEIGLWENPLGAELQMTVEDHRLLD